MATHRAPPPNDPVPGPELNSGVPLPEQNTNEPVPEPEINPTKLEEKESLIEDSTTNPEKNPVPELEQIRNDPVPEPEINPDPTKREETVAEPEINPDPIKIEETENSLKASPSKPSLKIVDDVYDLEDVPLVTRLKIPKKAKAKNLEKSKPNRLDSGIVMSENGEKLTKMDDVTSLKSPKKAKNKSSEKIKSFSIEDVVNRLKNSKEPKSKSPMESKPNKPDNGIVAGDGILTVMDDATPSKSPKKAKSKSPTKSTPNKPDNNIVAGDGKLTVMDNATPLKCPKKVKSKSPVKSKPNTHDIIAENGMVMVENDQKLSKMDDEEDIPLAKRQKLSESENINSSKRPGRRCKSTANTLVAMLTADERMSDLDFRKKVSNVVPEGQNSKAKESPKTSKESSKTSKDLISKESSKAASKEPSKVRFFN